MTTSAATSNGPHHQNVVPSEVGWQFVPQYYTFVNKEPHRLHCFYNKSSTFIHGTEGEDIKPCYGQQEIHKKITSIGFENCKVFIHSVDAQSSANGGIIIQVIGEMSNADEPWRKFVQTFFLAEQPNGYFVLNDIFRFLKEETVEEGSEYGDGQEAAAPAAPEPVFEQPREPTPPPPAPAPEPVVAPPAPEPPKEVAEPAPAPVVEPPVAAAPPAAPQTNGAAVPEPEKPAAPVAEKSREPTPAPPAPQQPPAPVAAPAPPAPAPAPAASSSTAPPQPAPPAAQPAPPAQQPPQQPPAPVAPPAPKTWASLAASNQKKWGSVAQETRGITETPASPAPSSGTQTPSHPQARPQQKNEHPALLAAQSITTPHCFVKGVVDPITDAALKAQLSQRFGPIKEVDIVRSKACAFLEFQNLDSAKRAIIASLNTNLGGDGGVYIETESGQVRIFVETKKERVDRPAPGRGRGGPPVNGDPRGSGFRGGRGGSQRGRGVSIPK